VRILAKIVVINLLLWTFVFASVVFLWYLAQTSVHPHTNANGLIPIVVGFGLSVGLLSTILVTPFWMIFRKAGFHPAFSLLMMVPVANFTVLYVVAFSEWKSAPAQKS
jgi:hypothetical protein